MIDACPAMSARGTLRISLSLKKARLDGSACSGFCFGLTFHRIPTVSGYLTAGFGIII